MYLPYLRGKQFELIAIRESLPFLSHKIIPIIEPVKKNLASLHKAVRVLSNTDRNCIIIINPKEGELKSNPTSLVKDFGSILTSDKIMLGYILEKKDDFIQFKSIISEESIDKKIALIHRRDLFSKGEKEQIKEITTVEYNIVDLDKTNRRYHRVFENVVSLDDNFIKQKTNVNYLNNTDESFSEEHLFYAEDGFLGFSDFLTIGEEYSETGFLPYAVAIHLTYLQNDIFRIRHFVSDTNDDNTNIAGKYFEAVTKLVEFINEIELKTIAANEFRELYKKEHYPGLGTLKKLSILNHLELVSKII